MKKNNSKLNHTNLLTMILGCVIFMFFITIIIGSVQVKIFHSQVLERMIDSDAFTTVFLFMLGEQIPQFNNSLNDDLSNPTLSSLAFEAVTRAKTNDASTLLLQEFPGFNSTNTRIYIAGEGFDYSNLPQESPPPDFSELLKDHDSRADEPLDKNNTGNNADETENSSVFIYHSHSWEGYLPLINEDVKPSDASSIDSNENVVLVGSMLSDKLKYYGINTLHNQTNVAKALKDKDWEYQNSYTLSREYVKTAISQYPSIEYYIDIHRDSARKISSTTTINGKNYARLYFVVGQAHSNYEENLMFAKDIHERLEAKYPGLSKGVYLKTKLEGNGVYNQDISTRSLLLEVGGIDNNKVELNNTINAFAQVFNEIYKGVIKVNAQ